MNTDAFVLTRGFKEEINLMSGYFASLFLRKSPMVGRVVNVVHRLWKKFVYLITRFKHVPVTEFERCLYQTISIDTMGGLYSLRSVSPLVSYAPTTPESLHSQSALRSQNSMVSRGKLDVAVGDLL